MMFLNDLDSSTSAMSIGAIALCAIIALHDLRDWRRKQPVRARRKQLLLWALAVLFAAFAIDTHSAGSDAQHQTVSGPVMPVRAVHYARGTFGVLAHLTNSVNASSLYFFDSAGTEVIRDHSNHVGFKVSFLDVPEEMEPGAYAFKVVDINNIDSGGSLYHVDTLHHPARVALLIAVSGLLFLTGLLSLHLANVVPDVEDDYENYRTPRDTAQGGVEMTSLNLNSTTDENGSPK